MRACFGRRLHHPRIRFSPVAHPCQCHHVRLQRLQRLLDGAEAERDQGVDHGQRHRRGDRAVVQRDRLLHRR